MRERAVPLAKAPHAENRRIALLLHNLARIQCARPTDYVDLMPEGRQRTRDAAATDRYAARVGRKTLGEKKQSQMTAVNASASTNVRRASLYSRISRLHSSCAEGIS